MVTQVNPSAVERLPITILGAPSAPVALPRPEAHPAVSLSDVHVVSESSWTSWFGAAAARELMVTFHNESSGPVRPLFVAGWIQGSDQLVVTSPTLKVVGAGRSTQITAPFSLSTFASGQFTVRGKITGDGFDVRFATSTATTPWGLYLLVIVIAVTILLSVAVLIGKRRTDQSVGDGHQIPELEGGDEVATSLTQTGALQ
jgi:hypothetical protein